MHKQQMKTGRTLQPASMYREIMNLWQRITTRHHCARFPLLLLVPNMDKVLSVPWERRRDQKAEGEGQT